MSPIKIIFAVAVSVFCSCNTEKRDVKSNTSVGVSDTLTKLDSIKPLTKKETAILKKLIDDEIDGQEFKDLDVKRSPFSVSFPNENDQYTVYFSILFSDDWNNDGIMDYIVLRDSEGMLGGNANTNQEYLFLVMKDENTVRERHSLLGYSPGSYNTLDSADFKNKKFTIEATQNYRTYSNEDLQSTSLSFVYQNGNVYEESYLSDCALAKLKSKTIFKASDFIKTRSRSVDMHNYTETIQEVFQAGDTLMEANLAGCDNLSLTFDVKYQMTKEQQENPEYKKAVVMKLLQFLRKNTQFPEVFEAVLEYGAANNLTDQFVEVNDNYRFRILIQKVHSDKSRLRYLLQIHKMDNLNQSENWEITTRQKGKGE